MNLHILLTFLVSGLWHGANWTFIVWGGLHGLYQVFEQLTQKARDGIAACLRLRPDAFPRRAWQVLVTFWPGQPGLGVLQSRLAGRGVEYAAHHLHLAGRGGRGGRGTSWTRAWGWTRRIPS